MWWSRATSNVRSCSEGGARIAARSRFASLPSRHDHQEAKGLKGRLGMVELDPVLLLSSHETAKPFVPAAVQPALASLMRRSRAGSLWHARGRHQGASLSRSSRLEVGSSLFKLASSSRSPWRRKLRRQQQSSVQSVARAQTCARGRPGTTCNCILSEVPRGMWTLRSAFSMKGLKKQSSKYICRVVWCCGLQAERRSSTGVCDVSHPASDAL